MGLLSSIGSALSSCCRGACSICKSVIGGIGNTLSNFASTALGIVGKIAAKAANFIGLVATLPLGPLGPVLGPIIQQMIIHCVAKAIEYLAKKLGIIKEHDKLEEVGYRIEEAQEHEDWKHQEDFKTFEEYYAYLKEQIPDDKIDLKKLDENRARYMVLGTLELTNCLEENLKIKMPEDFLFEIGRSRMETNEILAIVDAFKSLNCDSVYISDYFKGKLSRDENIKIGDALLVALKKYYPEKDNDYFYERLSVMRIASRDDMKLAEVYNMTEEKASRIIESKYGKELTEEISNRVELDAKAGRIIE